MKHIVHPSALDDLEEAVLFYEKQETGLGVEVYADLTLQMAAACKHPGTHRQVDRFYRYVACGRFPHFCICYTLEPDGLHVRAILDHRRSPRKIRRRLRDV